MQVKEEAAAPKGRTIIFSSKNLKLLGCVQKFGKIWKLQCGILSASSQYTSDFDYDILNILSNGAGIAGFLCLSRVNCFGQDTTSAPVCDPLWVCVS